MRQIGGIRLERANGGTVELGTGRGPRVLVVAEHVACATCRDYVQALAGALADAAEWGGRLALVAGEAPANPADAELLIDRAHALPITAPGVLVLDEWGEVHFGIAAGEAHDFPAPGELVDWVRSVAIHCPECEQPEGEWRTL